MPAQKSKILRGEFFGDHWSVKERGKSRCNNPVKMYKRKLGSKEGINDLFVI